MIINKMVEFFLQKHFGATIVLGVPLFTLGGTEFASIRRHQEKSIVAPLNTVRGFHQGVEQYIDDEKTQNRNFIYDLITLVRIVRIFML